MTLLLISQGLLWIVIVALALVILALTRQLGVLHERIAPIGALSINRRLTSGSHAPVFTVPSLSGTPLTIGIPESANVAARKSQLIFFLSLSCPVCKTLLPVLKSVQQRERAWLAIILASDGDEPAAHRKFIERHDLGGFPYVLSESLGITYGISRVPYAVLINARGVVSALGLVNSREQLESLFEAQRLTEQGAASEPELLSERAATEVAS